MWTSVRPWPEAAKKTSAGNFLDGQFDSDDMDRIVNDNSTTLSDAEQAEVTPTLSDEEIVEVGPARYCSPRHPTHFEPLFLALNITP